MKIVKHDLGPDMDTIKIMNLGDFHLGDSQFDEKLARETIEMIRDTPNMFAFINGDMINNAVRDSVSDIYTEEMTPEKQVDKLVEMFEPIKDKILGITSGNHEIRTYKQVGIDVMRMFAKYLDLEDVYDMEQVLAFISFGQNKHRKDIRHTVSVFVTHQGGTKARLTSMSDIVDADILFRGHYHHAQIHKLDIFKTDSRYKNVKPSTQMFVQNGACLKYGGYGAMKGYRPLTSVFPYVNVSIIKDGKQERLELNGVL